MDVMYIVMESGTEACCFVRREVLETTKETCLVIQSMDNHAHPIWLCTIYIIYYDTHYTNHSEQTAHFFGKWL